MSDDPITFDHIVASCWRKEVKRRYPPKNRRLNHEGQTFTGLTGNTFKVWSSLDKMQLEVTEDHPQTVFLTPGIYRSGIYGRRRQWWQFWRK